MGKIVVDGFLLSIQFLTNIPLRKEIQWDTNRAKASVATYPLVGLLLGILLVAQAYVLTTWTPISPLIIAAWLCTCSLLFSGGLHLDGWADVHDAIFSRRSKEEKLTIMQDPRIGTFAMIAVLLVLGWRFLFMWESIILHPSYSVAGFLVIPFLMRLIIGWQVLVGTFAKKDGLGAALQIVRCRTLYIVYSVWTVAAFIVLFLLHKPFAFLVASVVVFLIVWHKWIHYQIGGITGDTMGAGGEGGETVLWGVFWSLLLFGTA